MSAAVIQVTSAAKVLAQLRARNMVKDHIRRRGEKLSAYKSAEITSWARLYVEESSCPPAAMPGGSKEDDPSWAPWKTGAEGASCKTHNKCTKRGAANINHFGRANLMLKIKNDRAIYFGLIEQLIYEYVRSKYDHRLRKGEHRRPNARLSASRTSPSRRREDLQREDQRGDHG